MPICSSLMCHWHGLEVSCLATNSDQLITNFIKKNRTWLGALIVDVGIDMLGGVRMA